MIRLLATLAVAASCFSQALPEDVIHLARVRDNVRKVFAELPNYVCLVTTERLSASKPGIKPVRVDTVALEVAHVGNKELYSWPGRDQFEDRSPGEMIQHGVFGTGAFAGHLHDILLGGFSMMKFSGTENIAGRPAYRWSFRIPGYASGWTLNSAGWTVNVGSTGTLWADEASNDVLRLHVEAAEIPAGFPMSAVALTVEYARVRLGERVVLLPQSSNEVMHGADGSGSINRTAFSHCREYGATSTVSFHSTVQPGPENAAPKRPLEPLPAGLILPLELDAAIASDSVAVGDAITARVRKDVRRGAELLVPEGTVVHGRLRLMSRVDEPYTAYQVGLEFTTLDLPDGPARFFASMTSVESALPGFEWALTQETHPNTAITDRQSVVTRIVRTYRSELPGVGTFFMKGPRFKLPKKMRMTWVTEDPAPAPRR